MRKKILSTISILGTCIASLISIGCSTQKYQVDYCGQKILFKGAKNTYATGQEVTLYYDFIATDTDYSFYLDNEYLPVTYSDKKGFIIKFTMPDHDVKLQLHTRNTMEMPQSISNVILLDFYKKTFTAEGAEYCEIILKTTELESQIVMEVHTNKSFNNYVFPSYVFDDCTEIINQYNLRDWNKLEAFSTLDGVNISCRFRTENGSYYYASTDKMPENGEVILNKIYQLLLDSIQTQQ